MAFTEKYVTTTGAGAHDGSSEANAWTWAEAIAAYASGQRINVKAGTHSRTTNTDTFATSGTTTAPVIVRGYNTSIGDIASDETLTKPLITWTTGHLGVSGGHITFEDMSFQGAGTDTNGVTRPSARTHWLRCRFENTAANAAGYAIGGLDAVVNVFNRCWFKTTSTATQSVFVNVGATMHFRHCTFEGGGHGLGSTAAGSFTFLGCQFKACGGDGINLATTAPVVFTVDQCSFRGCGSDGIHFAILPTTSIWTVADCIFANNVYGINNATGANTNFVQRWNNAFYTNSSGKEQGFGDSPSFFEVTETVDPFPLTPSLLPAFASGSFSTGSPYPGTYENQTESGQADRGAVQSKTGTGRRSLFGAH